MELDKNCNNLNNIESLESDLSAAQTLDSNLNSFISVERRYTGVDGDNISVEVDQKAKTISATLKQNKFATMADFPEVGSDRQIYVDLSNKSLWIYDAENSEYVSVGGISGDKPTFESIQALVTRLNEATTDEINQGESLYVLTTNVPDFWVYKVVENKVEYAYTTDADLVSQIKTNGFVQIGHYQISILETEKTIVDSELSETSTNPVQNKVLYQSFHTLGTQFSDALSDKQDKLTAGENITIDKNNVISATGGGGGLSIADLPKFVNKIYINMANATALNGLMSLPCVESSNFIVTFPDGTSQEYIEPTTLIEHQFADANQEGWVYIYGDWKGISFGSSGYTNERKIITQIIYDNNITSMPTYALYNSSNLVRLGLPESLTTMNDHCIFNCDALKKIIIPDSVTKMGNQIVSSCSALVEVKIPNTATETTKVNNSLIYTFDIPHTVTEIVPGTFQACANLKSITIPDKVVKIGGTAFNACSNLKTVSVLPITPPTFTKQSDFQYVDQFFMPAQSLQQYKTATNWVLFADKIYPKGGNYSETITITADSWDTTTNTATVEAVGATSEARNVITWFTSSGGSQVENTYGLKCTAQGTMQLTFSCETIPTEDIEVSVSYMLTNY